MLTEEQIEVEADAILDRILEIWDNKRDEIRASVKPTVFALVDEQLSSKAAHTVLHKQISAMLAAGHKPARGYLTIRPEPTPDVMSDRTAIDLIRATFPAFVRHFCEEQGLAPA